MSLSDATPRLRMFAGRNGSGKSTIKSKIPEEILGEFINPDEIEAEINRLNFLDFGKYSLQTKQVELFNFFKNSTLLEKANLLSEARKLKFKKNRVEFVEVQINSYFASVIADFIRQKLILAHKSFSFETVMSSRDKVDFLEKARQSGYRNYLYFVATDDPLINISRVEHRVKTGGHDVPKDKIKTRYYRSLELLWDAIKLTNRAYIFDNSGDEAIFIAEITEAENIKIQQGDVPAWFNKYVLAKIE